ncbi:unnamed protein product [Auanema sp. JU1783]|nr:unnamed protein product [Auanema sp. JU1783]
MDLFRPNDSFIQNCQLNLLENTDITRLLLVGFIGTSVAVISILCNFLLLYVFSTSRRLRRQNYANPVVLALFDIIVSASYILLFSVNVIAYHFRIGILITIWTVYVKYIYVIKHICESICNFLLVVASIERLFANCPQGTQKSILVFMVRKKVSVFISLLITATIIKGTLFFETSIAHLVNCPLMERYIPIQNSIVDDFSAYRFWGRKSITVIIPFIMLIYCNVRIVSQLKIRRREEYEQSIKKRSLRGSVTSASIRKHYNDKKGVRVATRTLVLVVGCYLFSNSLSTIVNFWEYSNLKTVEINYYSFLILSDVALLLTIFGCALRLFIYCASDGRIRKATGRAFFRWRYKALPMEVQQNQLDRWSIVVVSNSLRSNLTNMNGMFASQDWLCGRSKRAKDELAFLLQNRRKILVDMTFRLSIDPKSHHNDEHETAEDWLTDIQEEDTHYERNSSQFRSLQAHI